MEIIGTIIFVAFIAAIALAFRYIFVWVLNNAARYWYEGFIWWLLFNAIIILTVYAKIDWIITDLLNAHEFAAMGYFIMFIMIIAAILGSTFTAYVLWSKKPRI